MQKPEGTARLIDNEQGCDLPLAEERQRLRREAVLSHDERVGRHDVGGARALQGT